MKMTRQRRFLGSDLWKVPARCEEWGRIPRWHLWSGTQGQCAKGEPPGSGVCNYANVTEAWSGGGEVSTEKMDSHYSVAGAGDGKWPSPLRPPGHSHTAHLCIWGRKTSFMWQTEQWQICLPKHSKATFSNIPNFNFRRWGVCHFWHAGIVDVPGVFGCSAPVKGKWLCFALWQLAKDFDLFMFQVGQGKLLSQQAGPWA